MASLSLSELGSRSSCEERRSEDGEQEEDEPHENGHRSVISPVDTSVRSNELRGNTYRSRSIYCSTFVGGVGPSAKARRRRAARVAARGNDLDVDEEEEGEAERAARRAAWRAARLRSLEQVRHYTCTFDILRRR